MPYLNNGYRIYSCYGLFLSLKWEVYEEIKKEFWKKNNKKTKTWSFHRASSVPVFHVNSSFAFYDYHALLVAFLPIAFYVSFACFLKMSLKVKEVVQELYWWCFWDI